MRRLFPTEFVYQVFSLLVAFIVTHAVYVTYVRPNAADFVAEQRAKIKIDPKHEPEQSAFVILKDYEQESEVILALWALAILIFKMTATQRERQHLEVDLVGLPDGAPITTDGALQAADLIKKKLPETLRDHLLPRAMLSAIDRFSVTRSVQDAATVAHVVSDAEATRLDSDLSILRYIAWAIPAIGFIGTVRGIGDALAQAHLALEGDISGVTESLGVAFNSTLVALLLSMVLMFMIHQLQTMQDKLILDTRRYCDDWLIRRLRA
jgi:biopolymer transport protein ExbB/TolQ